MFAMGRIFSSGSESDLQKELFRTCRASVGCRGARVKIAERGQLRGSRLRRNLQLWRNFECPAGGSLDLFDGDAGMESGKDKLVGGGIGNDDAEIGDDGGGPAAANAGMAIFAGAGEVARGSNEVELLDEGAFAVAEDDGDFLGGGGGFGGTARAGQPSAGSIVSAADDGGVDVAELVDLRGAEEAHVDAAALQPVTENFGDGNDGVGGFGELAVADGKGQDVRFGADGAGF